VLRRNLILVIMKMLVTILMISWYVPALWGCGLMGSEDVGRCDFGGLCWRAFYIFEFHSDLSVIAFLGQRR
jgi:hypothetical protein